jgi:GR25 family glycosyltransferase involved in LPS biosynthesis
MNINTSTIIIFIILIILVIISLISIVSLFVSLDSSHKSIFIYDIYVINVDKNKERLESFIKEYKQLKLANYWHIKKLSAVDGDSLTYDFIQPLTTLDIIDGIKKIDNTQKRISESQLTRGMLGCYLSHLELYKKHVNSGRPLLIFEDDAGFKQDISNIVTNIKDFPKDWDIILLGTVRLIKSTDLSNDWNKVYEFWGLQGYIINNKGMKKVIENAFPIQEQLDHHLGKLARMGILNIYAHKQNMVIQTSVYSTIQMNVTE